MRNKQKVDIMASMLCIFLGGLLLLFPLMKYTDINTSFMTIMFVYSIINSGKYLITKDLSDFKTILSSLASLFIGSLAFMIIKFSYFVFCLDYLSIINQIKKSRLL